MSDPMIPVTDANFEEEVLKSPLPVLVDFWAVWCVPCKLIAPRVEDVAAKLAGKLKVCKMDVDQSRIVPPRFGIRGIPTLLLFKGGELKETLVGTVSTEAIEAAIKPHL